MHQRPAAYVSLAIEANHSTPKSGHSGQVLPWFSFVAAAGVVHVIAVAALAVGVIVRVVVVAAAVVVAVVVVVSTGATASAAKHSPAIQKALTYNFPSSNLISND